jgi:hypothetical protein
MPTSDIDINSGLDNLEPLGNKSITVIPGLWVKRGPRTK